MLILVRVGKVRLYVKNYTNNSKFNISKFSKGLGSPDQTANKLEIKHWPNYLTSLSFSFLLCKKKHLYELTTEVHFKPELYDSVLAQREKYVLYKQQLTKISH